MLAAGCFPHWAKQKDVMVWTVSAPHPRPSPVSTVTPDFRNPKGMQVAEGGDQKENELLSEYQRTAREKVPWATGCRNAGG